MLNGDRIWIIESLQQVIVHILVTTLFPGISTSNGWVVSHSSTEAKYQSIIVMISEIAWT